MMFNEILEGGLNQVLTSRLGMKGGAAAPAVAPEIFPVMTLESDRPEWGFLKGERLMSVNLEMGAIAAQFRMVQLYVPTNVGTIVTIEKIVSNDANTKLLYRSVIGGALAGWAGVNTIVRDTRWGFTGSGAFVEVNSNAVAPTNLGAFTRLVASTQAWDTPIVLAPGGTIALVSAVVNQTLFASIHWRERTANPGELV